LRGVSTPKIKARVRGVGGKNLKLSITGGASGPWEAPKGIYPFMKVQRGIAQQNTPAGVRIREENQARSPEEVNSALPTMTAK
jgi:hypothetical protein